jgi:cytochrome c2
MQSTHSRLVMLLTIAGSMAAHAAAGAEDPVKGKALFENCVACHSLEAGQNGVGPTLRGLFGRRGIQLFARDATRQHHMDAGTAR